MLITKFNKMIKNKFIWGAFAAIVCLFFIGTGLSLRDTGCGERDPETAGEIFGEPVSRNEFIAARYFELGMRHSIPEMTEENAEQLIKNRVWKRLAALKTAEKLKIAATDDELVRAIHSEPSFSRNGTFDKRVYQSVVESSYRVILKTFEEGLRQQLTLQKLLGVFQVISWIPHDEINERLGNLTDILTVQYTTVSTNHIEEEISITTEKAREFFEENTELFRVPEELKVRYVAFPVTNYMKDVVVPESDIVSYYNANTNEFTRMDTNGVPTLIPLTNVADEIESAIKRNKALFKARKSASDFELAMASGRFADALTMEEAAETQNLTIQTSQFFSAEGPVPGLDVDARFNRAAFNLQPGTDHYFSSAIEGEDNVYIIATGANRPSHIPEFEDATDEVFPAARQAAIEQALQQKAGKTRSAIVENMKTGKSFTNAVAELGLEPRQTDEFSVYEMRSAMMYGGISNELEEVQQFAGAVSMLDKGEITEPVPADDGLAIACLADRRPADPALMSMLKPGLRESIEGYLAEAVFNERQDYILSKGG